jgi:hypothetical protein
VSDQPRQDQQPRPGEGTARPSGRRRRGRKPRPFDLWRPVPQLPEPVPIRPTPEPTALLRSLGDPPLQGQGAVAEHYIAAVVERAAGLAMALAAAGDLLDMGQHDD